MLLITLINCHYSWRQLDGMDGMIKFTFLVLRLYHRLMMDCRKKDEHSQMAGGLTGSAWKHSNWKHPGSLHFNANETSNKNMTQKNLRKKTKKWRRKRRDMKTIDIDLHSRSNWWREKSCTVPQEGHLQRRYLPSSIKNENHSSVCPDEDVRTLDCSWKETERSPRLFPIDPVSVPFVCLFVCLFVCFFLAWNLSRFFLLALTKTANLLLWLVRLLIWL